VNLTDGSRRILPRLRHGPPDILPVYQFGMMKYSKATFSAGTKKERRI
jgi:hypothetical protein